MLIDFHVHVYRDDIAPRALSHIAGVRPVAADGTAAGTRAYLSSLGISRACVLNIATKPAQVRTINAWANSLDRSFYIPFGAASPFSADLNGELQQVVDYGFPGIKLHPYYQCFDALSENALALYQCCEALGLIVLIHSGQGRQSPHTVYADPEQMREVIRQFPRLKLVIAHLGGSRNWAAAERYIAGEDVYLDVSHIPGELSVAEARRIIHKHDPERLLFGSDCPFAAAKDTLAFLDQLELSQSARHLLNWENAARLLGLAYINHKL